MAQLGIAFTLVIAFATSISAQNSLCTFFHVDPFQCAICGYAPSAPVYCLAYNATFDDLPSSTPVSIYKNTLWSNFTVLSSPNSTGTSTADPATVTPYSAPNFARLPSGQVGAMIFGFDNGTDSAPSQGQYPDGTLHYFHYACVTPISVSTSALVPAACTVNIIGTCLTDSAYNLLSGPFGPVQASFEYVPLANGSMAFEGQDFGTFQAPNITTQRCANYTFTATGEGGIAVDLLLDDVIYNTLTVGYDG